MKKWIAFGVITWIGFGVATMAGEHAWHLKRFDLGCGDESRRILLWQDAGVIPFGPIAFITSATSTGGFMYGFNFTTRGKWCGEEGEYADRCWSFRDQRPENVDFCKAHKEANRPTIPILKCDTDEVCGIGAGGGGSAAH